MIFSSGGISGKASASAERLSRARCSCSLKICETDVLQRRIVVLLDVRDDDLARIADQKTIRHRAKPGAIDLRQQVMRHLLLIKNLFPLWNIAGQSLDNFSPIRLAGRDHFRMKSATSDCEPELPVASHCFERLFYRG